MWGECVAGVSIQRQAEDLVLLGLQHLTFETHIVDLSLSWNMQQEVYPSLLWHTECFGHVALFGLQPGSGLGLSASRR